MKKLLIVFIGFFVIGVVSCGGSGDTKQPAKDSVTPDSAIDSAANNNVLPPSAAPGNAGNSSLADTTYKDTTKTKMK